MLSRKYIIVSMFAVAVTGCGFLKNAAKSAEDALNDEPAYPGVPGETATKFLSKASVAANTDLNAIKEALQLAEGDSAKAGAKLFGLVEEDEGDVGQVSDATVDFLLAGQVAKEQIQTGAFKLPELPSNEGKKATGFNLFDPNIPTISDPSQFLAARNDSLPHSHAAWGGKNEIMVSNVNYIPVRNQQERGTCAAFDGIGALEHMVLKKHPELKGIDLSEQRFYYLSRHDLWDKGGGVPEEDAGSYWGSGFSVSSGQAEVSIPSQTMSYNIPLEVDCPYVPTNGDNELQIPQSQSCLRGAVKVVKSSETYWTTTGNSAKTWRSNALQTAAQIVDYLNKEDLPVPIASKLDDAWTDNDGMITLARSKQLGTTNVNMHTGGHAYLIVGARKLDESKFPGEGGMCFVIKNSWGIGWGANGFSCMTLAWFNNFRSDTFFDVALGIEVDKDYIAEKLGSAPTPSTDEGADESDGDEGGEGDGEEPAAEPAATFKYVNLITGSGEGVQALMMNSGSEMTLRGIRDGGASHTTDLVLKVEGDKIFHTQEKNFMDITKQVGVIQSDRVVLCGEKFVGVCHLNYVPESNSLAVGLTEAEFRNDDADPNAVYETLVSFAGYGIEYSMAGLTRIDVRLLLGGVPSNPLRFKVSYVDGHIFYKDKIIGNFKKGTLCSGEHASVCRMVVGLNDRKLTVLFKAAKK